MSGHVETNPKHQNPTNDGRRQSHEHRDSATDVQDEIVEYHLAGGFEEIENVQLYNKGGHHPVNLGDVLDGRFEAVHKLGHGGFGIVWFCRNVDTRQWQAVKIMSASQSSRSNEINIYDHLQKCKSPEHLEANYILTPSESFWLDGPNGRHLCFVMPILGFPVTTWCWRADRMNGQFTDRIKGVCHQIAQAIRFLHHNGICHGDLKPDNVLMRIEGLDEMDTNQVMELLGEPELIEVETASGDSPQPKAPKHLVCPVELGWCTQLVSGSIAIVDFGDSFFADKPPKKPGHTAAYAAPEIFFEGSGQPGVHSDIWALACTFFEIYHGAILFQSLNSSGPLNAPLDLEYFIGAMPEPFRTARRNMIKAMYKKPGAREDETEPKQLDSTISEECEPLTYSREALKKQKEKRIEGTGYSTVLGAELGRVRLNRRKPTDPEYDAPGEGGYIKYRFPRENVIELSTLLLRMLRYQPNERITADEVLNDLWFHPV
ncbi:hypothetical protein NUW58_g1032 [Xylaria curta]|uniref:Uncharacterized protein n=1 Tax=Xylaria curta TaxID=42375 RepID=A0ACC1PNT0_9PEZI|nr:hypothetical protein NUW58_g1032 [Xylaria curta]